MDWQQTSIVPHMGVAFRALLKRPPRRDTGRAATGGGAEGGATCGGSWMHTLRPRSFVGGEHLTMGDIALGNAIHRWFKLPVERPGPART